jgi:hypothetical protein
MEILAINRLIKRLDYVGSQTEKNFIKLQEDLKPILEAFVTVKPVVDLVNAGINLFGKKGRKK